MNCRKLETVAEPASSCVQASLTVWLSSVGECCTYNTSINHLSASLLGVDVVIGTLHLEGYFHPRICPRLRNSRRCRSVPPPYVGNLLASLRR